MSVTYIYLHTFSSSSSIFNKDVTVQAAGVLTMVVAEQGFSPWAGLCRAGYIQRRCLPGAVEWRWVVDREAELTYVIDRQALSMLG